MAARDAVTLVDLMSDLVRAWRHEVTARGRDSVVTAPVLGLLGHLDRDGAQRIGHLAVRSGLGAPTVSRHLTAAEALGLVERTADPDDRRAWFLALSPRGRQVLEKYRAAQADRMHDVVADWTEDDLAALIALLSRLRDDALSRPSAAEVELASS